MKINGNAIRPGMIIEHKEQLWRVVKSQSTQPGKGGAYNQVELKNLRDGSKLNERFRSAQGAERVRLEEKPYQFLFADGSFLTFMDIENYEQVTLNVDIIGEGSAFLQEGMEVIIQSFEGEALDATLPDTVVLSVVETEPVVKGQTAASSYKPAVLDNGLRIMVPPHIESGTNIIVNTADSSYAERAKN